MSADPHLAPTVVRQMVASAVDLVISLGTYQRRDLACRRLASLAFVAENPEDPFGGTLVQQFCSYVPGTDRWRWDGAGLTHLPAKISAKFELASIDPSRLLLHLIHDD